MKFSRKPYGVDFFVKMGAQYEKYKCFSPDDEKKWSLAISFRAVMAEGKDEDSELKCAPDYPGYLTRRIGGEHIFVPFNLGSFFPGKTFLQEAILISRQVKLAYGHPICLSGSATFLGKINNTTDLDYCEYYPTFSGTLSPAVCGKIGLENSCYLMSVKCNSEKIDIDSDQCHESIHNLINKKIKERPLSIKLDYIIDTNVLGIITTTNVVLPVLLHDFESGAAELSFAYQEAILCAAAPPRTLANVKEFARYLMWLKADCNQWLAIDDRPSNPKAPLKCLKRALSAFLLIGYDLSREDVDTIGRSVSLEDLKLLAAHAPPGAPAELSPVDLIIASLNGGTLADIADTLRLDEIKRLAPRGHPMIPEHVVEKAHQKKLIDQGLVDEALEAAWTLAEGLTGLINIIFDQTEGSVA